MIKSSLYIYFFMLFSLGFAQQEKDSLILTEDLNTSLESRDFQQELSEVYTGDDYKYDIKDGESQNLLARFLRWLLNGISDTFGINLPPGTLKFLEYLIYFLLGSLAIYLLVKFLIGENLSNVFSKQAASIIDINLSEAHIENVDLDALIKDALKQKDYRLAIRYQYLRALKTLSQQNIIEWHFEKTNLDYQKEIKTPGIQSLFKEVSYLYDYIWYGEQPIDETKYEAAQSRFTALKKHILS